MKLTATRAAQVAMMAVREADNLGNNDRPLHTIPRSSDPEKSQQTFDWKATDKYQELCYFEIEVKNIFMTNDCSKEESHWVQIILKWQDKETLRCLKMAEGKDAEQFMTCAKTMKKQR